MRIRKNVARIAVFVMTGVVAISAVWAINKNKLDESEAISGTWASYVDTSWYNAENDRYKDYSAEPGSSKDFPYLINTANEFSGMRAFEKSDALAGKYIRLTASLDLSAHYWDPIELRGKGIPEEDIYNIDYSEGDWMAEDGDVVHFDGGSFEIKGMRIANIYDEVTVCADNRAKQVKSVSTVNEYYEEENFTHAGATGLFSYAYKTSIKNVRLDSPKIALSETSGVEATGWYWREIDVIDIAGAIVGASHNSRVSDSHVTSPDINYNARFGDPFGRDDEEKYFYSPYQIIVGGAVGYSCGQSIVANTSVKEGRINVEPVVNETLVEEEPTHATRSQEVFYRYMGVLDNWAGVKVGGVVGSNFQSVILSSCNGSDIHFSDKDYTLNPGRYDYEAEADDAVLYSYLTAVGGVTGNSSSWDALQACIYNSCAHGNINVESKLIEAVTTGGVVGMIYRDTMINTYYDGDSILSSKEDYLGEIGGLVLNESYEGYVLESNYYMDRGIRPYGQKHDENGMDESAEGAYAITTTQKLEADLNAGRELVVQNAHAHTGGGVTAEFISNYATGWAVQDGKHPLDCIGALKVGLAFPDNAYVGVPNTGVKR